MVCCALWGYRNLKAPLCVRVLLKCHMPVLVQRRYILHIADAYARCQMPDARSLLFNFFSLFHPPLCLPNNRNRNCNRNLRGCVNMNMRHENREQTKCKMQNENENAPVYFAIWMRYKIQKQENNMAHAASKMQRLRLALEVKKIPAARSVGVGIPKNEHHPQENFKLKSN